jgi:peptide deformylase
MAILPIRLYPDPVLRVPCPPVETFDGALKKLAADMAETMYAAPGVGLAAPQVGVELQLAVVDVTVGKDHGQLFTFVNPKISSPEGREVEPEGCLSIPSFTDKVSRPAKIHVEAQDLEGQTFRMEAEGFLARAICHEVDHLHGILFVDHLRGLRKDRARRALKRLAAEARGEAG